MTRKKDPRTPRLPAPDPLDFTPVPRQRMRRGGWSAARQREFIDHLVETGSVRAACRRMGVGEHHIYKLRNHPEGGSFRAAWEAALDMGIQRIEDLAMDRAMNGVEEPVYSYGELVGTRIKYNDRLLMFILRNRAPGRFGAGSGGGRGLGAVSQMQLDRLKKQWIKEHEAKKPHVTAEQIRASIDRKIEIIRMSLEPKRQAQWAALSEETRAAWANYVALRTRDLAALNADAKARELVEVQWDAKGDVFEPSGKPVRATPGYAAPASEPPPPVKQWQKPEPPEVPPVKTSWTVKDGGFDP